MPSSYKYEYFDPDDDLEEEELRATYDEGRRKKLAKLIVPSDERLTWYYWALGFAIFFLVSQIVYQINLDKEISHFDF